MQGRLLFSIAILIGIYSYFVFFAGLFGNLNKSVIGASLIIIFAAILVFLFVYKESVVSIYIQAKKNSFYFLILLFCISVNLIGVIGPELGFDALWYHLVIPKLFIEWESINFIRGGLLYYSAMPKLVDMLYIPALMFGNELTVKFIHFLFGILTTVVTYKIANLFLDKKWSYLAAVVFYSNLVVGWMSITGYIDLGRAFFGTLSIYSFLLFYKTKDFRYFFLSSILAGFEVATKFLGFSTLISLVLAYVFFIDGRMFLKIKNIILYVLISVAVVTPWLIFSYISTNHLFYPFFTDIYPSGVSILSFNPLLILKDTIGLFLFSADPISPIYLIFLPIIVFHFKSSSKNIKLLIFILAINLLIWNFVPQKNSRFIIPYLPIFSVLAIWGLSVSTKNLQKIGYIFLYFTFILNIIYRGVANFKYVPVILVLESKKEFLVQNLNFDFGDYLDVENKVERIVKDEKVLIKGIHNLYYVDFSFDHESWAKGDNYSYILTRGELEDKNGYNLIYIDLITNTYLYEKN